MGAKHNADLLKTELSDLFPGRFKGEGQSYSSILGRGFVDLVFPFSRSGLVSAMVPARAVSVPDRNMRFPDLPAAFLDVARTFAVDTIVAAEVIAVSVNAAANSAYFSDLQFFASPCSDTVRSEFVVRPISSKFCRGGAVMDFLPTLPGFGLLNGSNAFPVCTSADTGLNVAAGRPV